MAIKTIEYKGFVIRYDNTFAEAYSNNRSVWYTKNLKSLKEHIDFYGEARGEGIEVAPRSNGFAMPALALSLNKGLE